MKTSRVHTIVILASVAIAAYYLAWRDNDNTRAIAAEDSVAADTPDARQSQAGRCVTAAPTEVVAKMICGRIALLREDIPAARRDEFANAMLAEVDIKTMTEKRKEMMAKHFTATELDALANFYESGPGRSAWQKLGTFVVDMQSEMRPKILEAESQARAKVGLPARD